MIRVGIIGALGYAGGELVRLLSTHPEVELTYLSSEMEHSKRMADVLPNLRGFMNAVCEVLDEDVAIKKCDVVFSAQHSGWAIKKAGKFLDAGVKLIDLSADFRLKSVEEFEHWYGMKHESPALLEEAVYGLPELYAEQIKTCRLLANPGCYPTSAILALAPALASKLIDPSYIIVDSKSGVSGAGRMATRLDFHFPELNQNMRAYNIAAHRHTPEIEQELGFIAKKQIKVSFTPHLIPITRGIITTAYAPLKKDVTTEQMVVVYRDFYRSAPFVYVLEAGEYPSTKCTWGSNYCHIGLKVDTRTHRLVVVSVIDNLVKGAAGQAVQNMNLMFGLDERAGLHFPGMWP